MGEIGLPIFKLLSKNMPVDGLDKIENLNSEKFIDIKKIYLTILFCQRTPDMTLRLCRLR